jgi:NitT/TauT family transport system substrate-binding protein
VVTWKPLVSQIRAQKGITTLFDSSKVPAEILDLLVVRTDVLKRPDGAKFARAITGAWYEVMNQLSAGGAQADIAIQGIAAVAGDTPASFKEQLSTTHLYRTPAEAVSFTTAKELQAKMELVRQFCFHHELLGRHVASPDDVAIAYPDGTIQGKKERVRLRFEPAFMRMAREGKL